MPIQKLILKFLSGFHDCVSDACDGCINIDNEENAGLAIVITYLEEVYADLQAEDIQISRADFWAIAGRAAAEYGMEGMPGNVDSGRVTDEYLENFEGPFAPFKFGRVDCPTAPYTSDIFEFPNPHMTHDEMFDWFREHFENQLSDEHV